MSWPQNPGDPQWAQQPAAPQPQQPPPLPPQGYGQPPQQQPPYGYPPQQPQGGYAFPQQQPPPYGQQQGMPQQVPNQPYGGQPFGQQSYGGQPPVEPPRKRRTALIATAAVVGLAVIGTGVTLALNGGTKPRHTVADPSTSSSRQPAVPTPSDEGPALSNTSVRPLIPGWQTQTDATHGFAYDVPPISQKWKVNSSTLALAYTDKDNKPVVVMSGSSEYHIGGCSSPGQHSGPVAAGTGQLATVGEQGSSKGTLQDNARNVAGNWVWAAYGGADGHKPQHITVSKAVPWNHNGVTGYMAKATATGIYRPSACVPSTAVSYGISMRLKDGSSGLWVIYADQGVPGALTDAQMRRIMGTVRPYTSG